MAAAEYDGSAGGKIRKRLLRRVPSTPYERPALAARALLPSSCLEGRGSGWLSRLVDPASRVIARSASRLLSSVLRKRLTAPLVSPGENLNSIRDAPEVYPSAEVNEHSGNVVDGRGLIGKYASPSSDQERNDGTDGIFELEQLIKQKKFTRAETEHLKEIMHSITLEQSALQSAGMKIEGKVNDKSPVNPSSSREVFNHAVNHKMENASELQDQGKRKVQEEDAPSPLEIAKAYMGSRPLKAVPSTLGSQRKSLHQDKPFVLNMPVGDVPSTVAIASSFSEIPTNSHNGDMTPKLHGRSAIYKTSHLPYWSRMMNDLRGSSPLKESYPGPRKLSEWTPTSIFMQQAQKRGSIVLDNDAEYGHSWRVNPKLCVTSLPSSRTDSLSTSSPGSYTKQQNIHLDVAEKSDDRKNLACVGPVPPKSAEMARKILHQLDKLVSSPKSKSSERKVIIGDASSSKSFLSTSHAGNSNIAGMISSESPILDRAKGKGLPNPPLVEAMATSSGFGFTCLPTQKEPTLQNASTKNVTFSSETEPLIHSSGNLHISRLINFETSAKEASDKPSAEKDASFTWPAAQISCALSKPPQSFVAATPSADEVTLKFERNPLPIFRFGSKGSTADAPGTLNTGSDASISAIETMINHPASELGKSVAISPFSTSASSLSTFFASTQVPSSSPSTSSAAPMFKFGSDNSAAYSFSALSCLFPSTTALSSTSFASTEAPASLSCPSTSSSAPIMPSITFQFGNGNSGGYSFSGLSNLFASTVSGISSSLSPVKGGRSNAGNGSLPTSSSFPNSVDGTFSLAATSTISDSSLLFSSQISNNTVENRISNDSRSTTGQVGSFDSQRCIEDNMIDEALQAAPRAQLFGQPASLSLTPIFMSSSATPSGTQTFHFGSNHNSSVQASGNGGFSTRGSVSLGSGGGEKSERRFIRVRRDKQRRK